LDPHSRQHESSIATAPVGATAAANDFLGHPRGLAVLFTAEMWERFSYFGNAALVVLYMVKYLFDPVRIEQVIGFSTVKTGLEFLFGHLDPQPLASLLFGFYTGLAYSMPIVGGLLADRVLGQRRTVIIGGVLMACGHFMMAAEALFLFALLLLILGIGAFKPNISTQVGALYASGDGRRDRGYAIFYIGINIGASLAPLVCGTLAVAFGWHYGFAAAGIGMLISLGIYLAGQRALPPDNPPRAEIATRERIPLDRQERRVVLALVGICALVAFFWAAFDQQGNTILLWAEDFTDRTLHLGGGTMEIPTAWFLALNPLMIFVIAPPLIRWWSFQARRGREPPALRKMVFGCLCVASANLVMLAAASAATGAGKASPLWLVGYFVLVTIGELHLAPIGLALIATVAPVRIRSMMMGVWFAATLPGDILAGYLGGFWSSLTKESFFLLIAAVAGLAAAALWAAGYILQPMLRPHVAGIRASRDPNASKDPGA
jgi:proton-dependent oligopeptide transporter, POT family